EEKIRQIARERFGGKKGSIAKAIKEAVNKTEEEDRLLNARKRLLELMEKGFDGGRIVYKHRSELYERK
ncbi:hypothetical protein KKE06_03200, partial [Candidatus Micrarchaeota archaeon]|nr:hypothetical protein [Candidatus Micrarchaeota archaeon]MBU1930396.1 hypothetical protein [Candidatus Micrarchaeota archaeon]